MQISTMALLLLSCILVIDIMFQIQNLRLYKIGSAAGQGGAAGFLQKPAANLASAEILVPLLATVLPNAKQL